jgi:hypothetical protein
MVDADMTVIPFTKPVKYTVELTHHCDGRLEVYVYDLADDERSRESVAWALEEAARMMRK